MFKLDDNLLIELGLGALPPAEKNRMLGHIYETLEMRVGMKLAQRMTNGQLDEFEAFIDRNDESGALKWLEANFPNYKQVVAEELEILKGEIRAAAPQIVAASQQAVAAGASQANLQPAIQQPQQPGSGYQPVAPQATMQQFPQQMNSYGQVPQAPPQPMQQFPSPAPQQQQDTSVQQYPPHET